MKQPTWRTIGLVAAGTILAAVFATAAEDVGSRKTRPAAAVLKGPDGGMKVAPFPNMPDQRRGGPFGGPRGDRFMPGTRNANVRVDRGVLKTIDAGNMVIDQNGTDLRVPVGDQTLVMKDGAKATLADLKAGDVVAVRRERKDGGDFTTTAVIVGGPRLMGPPEMGADGL